MTQSLVGFDGEWCRCGCGFFMATGSTPDGIMEFWDRPSALRWLQSLDPTEVAICAHNGRSDWKTIGWYPAGFKVYDSILLAWLYDEEPLHGLKVVAPRYLGRHLDDPIKFQESTGRTLFNGVHISEADPRQVAFYCGQDSLASVDLTKVLLGKLSAEAMRWYDEVESQLDYVLYLGESRGIAVDEALLHSEVATLQPEVDALVARVHKLVGYEFNLNSTPQMRNVLYSTGWSEKTKVRKQVGNCKTCVHGKVPGKCPEDCAEGKPKYGTVDVMIPRAGLGLKTKRLTKGKELATDKEALMENAGHPVVDLLLEHSKVDTVLTYLKSYPKHITDGRLHGTFKAYGTVTGRLSSSDPNMQNIPRRGSLGKRVRSVFVAAPGNSLVVADLDQIEYRILAELSGEPNLIGPFVRGEDVHQVNADHLGIDRDGAKTNGYAAIYEVGPKTMAQQLTLAGNPTTAKQAAQRLEDFYALLPGVPVWKEKVRDGASRLGYVITLGRRKRHLPDVWNPDQGLRARALRQAVNAVIQGSAADLVKMWMLETEKAGVPVLMQVHDELVGEVPTEKAEWAAQVMADSLQVAVHKLRKNWRVPITTTPKIAQSWGDAK